MNVFSRAARLGIAIAAGVAMPCVAQTPYSATLKLRAGTVTGAVTDVSLGRRTQGFGVEVARKLGKGNVFAEVTYDAFNGYRKDVTQYGGAIWYAGNGTQDPLNPSAPSTTYEGHNLFLNPDHSLYGEMLEYQGFGLRLGYRAPIGYSWAEGWDWQAGLSIDRRETRHEVMMTLSPVYINDLGETTRIAAQVPRLDTPYYEGMRFTRTTNALLFGAFAGVSHSFNEIFRTEVTARYTTFKTPHYVPFTYSGKAPTISESTKGGLVLEVALGITL